MVRFGSIQATEATALVFIFLQFLRWQVDKTDLEKSYEILSANIGYNPRERTHNLTLPTDGNAAIKQNFVYRMLFRDIDCVFMFYCYFVPSLDVCYIINFMFFSHFIPCCMCVCHNMCIKVPTYLLT